MMKKVFSLLFAILMLGGNANAHADLLSCLSTNYYDYIVNFELTDDPKMTVNGETENITVRENNSGYLITYIQENLINQMIIPIDPQTSLNNPLKLNFKIRPSESEDAALICLRDNDFESEKAGLLKIKEVENLVADLKNRNNLSTNAWFADDDSELTKLELKFLGFSNTINDKHESMYNVDLEKRENDLTFNLNFTAGDGYYSCELEIKISHDLKRLVSVKKDAQGRYNPFCDG